MPLEYSKGIFILHTFVYMRYIFLFILIFNGIQIFAQIELPDESIQNTSSSDTSINIQINTKEEFTSNRHTANIIEHSKDIVPDIFSKQSWADFQKSIELTGKKYFLDFTATWCGPCKTMNTQVFTDSMVVDITSKNYLAKQIDIDDFDGIGIAQKYNISALPTILFFDCNGKILKRLEGLQYADMFIHQLFIHK